MVKTIIVLIMLSVIMRYDSKGGQKVPRPDIIAPVIARMVKFSGRLVKAHIEPERVELHSDEQGGQHCQD